jgi:glycosyltransferase involved in cell wall biosynthesis
MTVMTTVAAPTTPGASAPGEARRAVLPGVSIVLPCFNEEANVADAVRAASKAARDNAAAFEVIVVDDGSTDRTSEVASDLMDGTGHVRLLVHAHNRGYGAALRTGIAAARQPWVLLTDADLQFDLAQLEDFAPLAASADVVAGRRLLRDDPIGRRVIGVLWSGLTRCLFRVSVSDVDCAFKLIRRDLVERVHLTSDGALVSAELLVKLQAEGAQIVELGVRHRARVAGDQSGASPRVVGRAFRELVRQQRELRRLSHA